MEGYRASIALQIAIVRNLLDELEGETEPPPAEVERLAARLGAVAGVLRRLEPAAEPSPRRRRR